MTTLACPHCGAEVRLALELAAPPIVKLALPKASELVPRKSTGMCACGHERSWHEGNQHDGKCLYGRGTPTGGCTCSDYHTRKRKTEPVAARAPRRPGASLSKCAAAVLGVLVQRGKPTSKAAVAILSEYSVDSGGFAGALAELRAGALIAGPADALAATQAGRVAAGTVPPLPSGDAIVEYWASRVGPCAGAILQRLTAIYPRASSRDDLAEVTGYSATSGGFAAALATLRTLSLVDGFRASDELMQSVRGE